MKVMCTVVMQANSFCLCRCQAVTLEAVVETATESKPCCYSWQVKARQQLQAACQARQRCLTPGCLVEQPCGGCFMPHA